MVKRSRSPSPDPEIVLYKLREEIKKLKKLRKQVGDESVSFGIEDHARAMGRMDAYQICIDRLTKMIKESV